MLYSDFKSVREVNKHFRKLEGDESKKWPILGRFNATERAIRRLRKLRREIPMTVFEYALALECEITRIVNDTVGCQRV